MRVLAELRRAVRVCHYSARTEEAYVGWARRFVKFCGVRRAGELGLAEARAFLTHLAQREGVSAATQNQAACALGFLFRQVLVV